MRKMDLHDSISYTYKNYGSDSEERVYADTLSNTLLRFSQKEGRRAQHPGDIWRRFVAPL